MDIKVILGVSLVLLVVVYLLKGLSVYLKGIGKGLARSFVAFFGIWAINLIGGTLQFHLGLNLINALIIGFLGLPGIALLLGIKYIL